MCGHSSGLRSKLHVKLFHQEGSFQSICFRTKFLSDDWMYERSFLDIKDEPNSEWWHAMPVSNLTVREPVTVSASTTIQSVLDIMHARGFDQIPVISDDG